MDLSVVSAGRYDVSRDLPAVLSEVAGRIAVQGSGQRMIEVTTHLDLTEADNLAAARGLLGGMTSGFGVPSEAISASRALRQRLLEQGTVEARVLDQMSSSSGVSGHLSVLAKLGAGYEREERSARLLAAVSRGLDGQWLAREDCL